MFEVFENIFEVKHQLSGHHHHHGAQDRDLAEEHGTKVIEVKPFENGARRGAS